MRIIGGCLGGRRLSVPTATATRPSSDRVREAIFNMLTSLHAIEGATVLDLFAGSGALGIEALSRGAAHATFVESDPRACRTIKANLATLGIGEQASVIRADARRGLNRPSPGGGPVDVAFADPPYCFDAWHDLLDAVGARVLICESDREIQPLPRQGWETVRVRRYGTPVVTVLVGHDRLDATNAANPPR